MLMLIAHIAAMRGTCGRLAVGAVIAREARPISLGYVGPPSGEPHCDPGGLCDLSQPCLRTFHAERNAIDFAKKWGISVEGADLYTTDLSCADCAARIITAKIKRVYYDRPYRAQALEMLLDNHVEVYQILANGMLRQITNAT